MTRTRCTKVGPEHATAVAVPWPSGGGSTRGSRAIQSRNCVGSVSRSGRRGVVCVVGGGRALDSACWGDASDSAGPIRAAALGALLIGFFEELRESGVTGGPM